MSDSIEEKYIHCPECNSYIPADSVTCRICDAVIVRDVYDIQESNIPDEIIADEDSGRLLSGIQKAFSGDEYKDIVKLVESPWPLGFVWGYAEKSDVENKNIGEYVIKDIIGRGGMGVVLYGLHPIIDKKVAIKILRPELSYDEQTMKRFIYEAKAVNAIGHPNIVDIFSFGGFTDGTRYLVMEYLSGESLSDYLKRNHVLSYSMAFKVLRQLFSALKAAHKRDIIHRDLKPDNIFLKKVDDEIESVKILDFGIAKFSETGLSVSNTKTGTPIGTPVYMSPEQCAGTDTDVRSDIYSIGIIMYRMFTGQVPFMADSLFAVLAAHISTPPIPPGDLVDIPSELENIILWCLAKDRESRPQSISQLSEALFPVLENIIKSEENNKSPSPIKGTSFLSLPKITPTGDLPVVSSKYYSKFNINLVLLGIIILITGTLGWGVYVIRKIPDNQPPRILAKRTSDKSRKPVVIPGMKIVKSGMNNIRQMSPLKPMPSHSVKPVEKSAEKKQTVHKPVILHLQIEPANVKYKIKINGKSKTKNYISIPWNNKKYVKIEVTAPGYQVWSNVFLPVFDQTLYVPLQKHKNKNNKNIMNNKLDIPDIL